MSQLRYRKPSRVEKDLYSFLKKEIRRAERYKARLLEANLGLTKARDALREPGFTIEFTEEESQAAFFIKSGLSENDAKIFRADKRLRKLHFLVNGLELLRSDFSIF